MNIIETNALTKRYGRLTAVNRLSIEIKPGQVFGILGPNGSGKTTTLGMLGGVTNLTSGSFKWFGEPATPAVRKRVGLILERPNFYPYMNAMKNLEVVATIKELKDRKRLDDVLQIVGLYDRRFDRFKTYSLGMKQRLSIASALLTDPEVLILDEPTNGLDPQGIAEIRELIVNISQTGKTIVLASHLLDEVQKVCTHFMIMSKGKLMHSGPVSEVSGETTTIEVSSDDLSTLKTALEQIDFVTQVEEGSENLLVKTEAGFTTQMLNTELVKREIVVSHLVQNRRSLEQKFLEILATPK